MSNINRWSSSLDSFAAPFVTPRFVPQPDNSANLNRSEPDSGDAFPASSEESFVKQQEFRNAESLIALAVRNKFAFLSAAQTPAGGQTSVSQTFIDGKADALINASKITVKKIDEGKLMDVLAQQAAKNPKLVAATLFRPAISDNRYNYAKGLSMRLSDAQLKQLSQTETGRSFLRKMMDIVYTEAPPERGNAGSEVWRDIDSKLLARVQSKVLEYSGKQ